MNPMDELKLREIAKALHEDQLAADSMPPRKSEQQRLDNGQNAGVPPGSSDDAIQIQDRIRQSDEKHVLTTRLAHDVNNQLLVIYFSVQQLFAQLRLDDPSRAAVTTIDDAQNQAAKLMQQLSDSLTPHSVDVVQKPIATDLNGYIVRAESMLRKFLRNDVIMTVKLASPSAMITANPDQVDRVVLHLILSALSSVRNGGWVTIKTCYKDLTDRTDSKPQIGSGRYLQLSVTDTGDVITHKPINLDNKLPTTTAGSPPASVLETLVLQCGGKMNVVSSLEAGTRMDVYFPAAADFVETARVSAPRSEDYSGMETILVVEDEPLIRAFIKQILGSYGYHVLEACDGTNAIDVTRDNSGLIQLLITDVLLPDISGTDVARQLRQLRPDLAVIFISGQAFEEMREAVSQVSPTGFLLKPFRAVDLLTKVRAILDTCVDRSVSTSTS